MIIEAIQNHIVFEFIDQVTNSGVFEGNKTDQVIELLDSVDNSASQARWARIVSLGPDCSSELREPDCEILIENLKWTAGVVFSGRRVWRTDDTYVLAYRVPDGSGSTTF
jgi:hypothetical protein